MSITTSQRALAAARDPGGGFIDRWKFVRASHAPCATAVTDSTEYSGERDRFSAAFAVDYGRGCLYLRGAN
ncbi:MAG TPA: hypothetical protein VLE19_01980 [Pyrinomonadaceae bacterium]|nr:hypothetical protein [Pyrinomonadaceae bacterium]